MNDRELIAQWQAEEAQPFQGWDFSYIADRYHEEEPPFSYVQIARELVTGTQSVLDLGTGGGEVLLSLRDTLPANTMATEGYAPNIPIARANLEPHGIKVIAYNIDVEPQMPFPDATVDVVLDRHEAYDSAEVARILRSGGVFLTQQVDGRDIADLLAVFGKQPEYLHVRLENCRKQLEDAGMIIERAEDWAGKVTFDDIGALVYFLHAAPWSAPDDFSVERYADQLLQIYKTRQPITFTTRRFLIQARKP